MTRYDALSLPPVTAADLLGYARGMRRTIILYAISIWAAGYLSWGMWALLKVFLAAVSR